MIHIAKILVPIDLSPRSIEAARYAAFLRLQFGSELVFLHALQEGWPLRADRKEVRDRIMNLPGTAHRFLVREGAPATAILRTAEAEQAGLILMQARPKTALSRILDGSITARVLRCARCPVWAGLGDDGPPFGKPIRTILCGLSLGPRASAVLRWSAGLAARLRASLSVIHASKGLAAACGYPCDQEWKLWLKKMTRDDIRTIQAGAGTNADVWLEAGGPLAAIPPLADQLRADLLVIGKSPPRRLFGDLRTLSYEMACRAPCPVASV